MTPTTETTLLVYPDAAFEENPEGSKEFGREANRFLAHFQLDPATCTYRFPTGVEFQSRAPGVLAAIEARKDLRTLVVLSHGWDKGIQPGFSLRSAPELAQTLAAHSTPDLTVVLYCCHTAEGAVPTGLTAPGGDGGFADTLRDDLCLAGCVNCRVYGHDLKGHTTKNPRVRVFEGTGARQGGQGGQWLIEPGTPIFKRWNELLHAEDSTLHFDFPFLTNEELLSQLRE